MFVEEAPLDPQYFLNLSGKITGRSNISFPVIETTKSKNHQNTFNHVNFVYFADSKDKINIYLIGDFDYLYKKRKLHQIFLNDSPTRFWAITLKLPIGNLFYYKFLVNNKLVTDPLNTLSKTLDNNIEWSVCFTHYYKNAIVFEKWEWVILQRLVSYLLPFKTDEFDTFVNKHQGQFNNMTRSLVSQLNYDIGCVNFIDKLIAKDERHHIIDYKLCLKEIKRILLLLNQFQEPGEMDEYFYQRVYEIMINTDFSLWDKSRYEEPDYFIKVLRRHIITAAFSHPKYGGNTLALGWQFLNALLKENNEDNAGYDWRQAIEKPLGTNTEYAG